jgi:hypothetical protein
MDKFYERYIDSLKEVALTEADKGLMGELKKVNGDPNKLYEVISGTVIDTALKLIEDLTKVLNNKEEEMKLKVKVASGIDFEVDRKKKVVDILIGEINKEYKDSIDLRYIQSLINYNRVTICEPTEILSSIIPYSLAENPFFIDMKSNLDQATKYIAGKKYNTSGLDKLVDDLVNIKTKYETYISKAYGSSVEDIQSGKLSINFDKTKKTYTGSLQIKSISTKSELKYMYAILDQENSSYEASKATVIQYTKLSDVLEQLKVTKKDQKSLAKLTAYITTLKDVYKTIVFTRSSILDIMKKTILKSMKLKLSALNDYTSYLSYIRDDKNDNRKLAVSNKDYSIGFSSGIIKEASIIDQEDFNKLHGVPIDLDSIYDIYYDMYDNDEDREEVFAKIRSYAKKKAEEVEAEKGVVDLIKDKIIEGTFFDKDYDTLLQEAIVDKAADDKAKETLKEFNDKMNELSKKLSESMSVLFGKAKSVTNRNMITRFFVKKNLDTNNTMKDGPNILTWIDRMTAPVPFNLNNGESIIKTINDGNAIIVERLANNLNNFDINRLDNKESYNDLFKIWFLLCNADKLRAMNLYREGVRYSDMTNETKIAMYNYIISTSTSIYRSLQRDMKYATNIANMNMFRKVVDKIDQERVNDHSMTADMVNNPEGENSYKQKAYNINTYATKYSNLIYNYFKIKINAYYKLSKTILDMVNTYVKYSSPSFDIISQADISDRVMENNDNTGNELETNIPVT